MKKFCGALLACLLLLTLTSPTWAQHAKPHNPWQKHYKAKRFKVKILHQFRELKHKYKEAHPDAQKMFRDYLGAAIPSNDEEIQKLKEQYEAQIAALNGTINGLQGQLTDSEAACQIKIEAELAAQEAQLAETCQQQLSDKETELNDACDLRMADKEAELNDACDLRIEEAYNSGVTEGFQQCSASITPLQLSAWDTGSVYPYGIDTDAAGNMIVLDIDAMNVVTFDAQGNQTAQWGSGSFASPVDVAVDSQGNVFVLDAKAGTPLQKYNPAGAAQPFTPGAAISNPSGLFIDSHDMIYVTDMGGPNSSARIQVFDATGNLVTTSGETADLAGLQFKDVAVDEVNQIIYALTDYNVVAKFDMNGNYLTKWRGVLRSNANGIAIGKSGQVFIADTFYDRIQQFDADGNLQATIAQGGQLYRPYHIVVDTLGRLIIADYRYNQILMYQ